jgi:hypothetical protein
MGELSDPVGWYRRVGDPGNPMPGGDRATGRVGCEPESNGDDGPGDAGADVDGQAPGDESGGGARALDADGDAPDDGDALNDGDVPDDER